MPKGAGTSPRECSHGKLLEVQNIKDWSSPNITDRVTRNFYL